MNWLDWLLIGAAIVAVGGVVGVLIAGEKIADWYRRTYND